MTTLHETFVSLKRTADRLDIAKDVDSTEAPLMRVAADRSRMGHGDNPAPPRRLACANCGHGFTVVEGEDALTRKRRRQAGITRDPNEVRNALKALPRVRP